MPKDCIFCGIVNGQTDTPLLFENEHLVVFRDIHPHAPVHLLIVPKEHIRSVNDLTDDHRAIIAEMTMVAARMAIQEGVDQSGYKLLYNVEWGAGQRVFHLHLHLLGGKQWG
jgi:histidine triad (HIT) family protein